MTTTTIQLNAGDSVSFDGKDVIRANGERLSVAIYETQQAYAARPFAVAWRDSHFSGTFRFDTLDQAYADIQSRWARIQAKVAAERYTASQLWQSYLETPTGRVRLAYVLLCDNVSSY
jgi:hypothetical protein